MYYFLTEIYLSALLCILLGVGVFLFNIQQSNFKWISQLKLNKENSTWSFKKINLLASLSLLFAILILINQDLSNDIFFCSDLFILNESIILIKIVLLLSASIIILLPSKITDFEYSSLIILSLLGMLFLVSANDIITIYLSIELMSLSFYILAAINRKSQHSNEAGIKYFLLGALSSGLLLFGFALLYAFTGETNLQALSSITWFNDSLAVPALFIIIALLFKLAAAPFHMWAPDTYEGAPTNVTAFFAVVPKLAILFTLVNLLLGPFQPLWEIIQPLFIISAIASLIVGSIAALNQAKIKRVLAYSAISHVGFILIGIIPLTDLSIQATSIYILLYIIMSINTFTIILNASNFNYISQFSGLSRFNPVLALTFSFTLLSMAGIPPLAGFFSKYLILINAIDSGYFLLALIAVTTSAISTFYYLRLIKWFFFKDSLFFSLKTIAETSFPTKQEIKTPSINLISSIILGFTTWIIITFMFFPEMLSSLTFLSVTTSLI